MGITAYRFNSDARYAAGAVGTSKEGLVVAAPDPLMRYLYYFHVYYQMRRILDELQAPLPQNRAWAPSITHTIGENTNRSVTSLGFRPTQTGA